MAGDSTSNLIRSRFAVPDQTSYVPALVMHYLLDIIKVVGDTPNITSEDHLSLALEAVQSYVDRNYKLDSGVITFWEQRYNNDSKLFYSNSRNLAAVFPFADRLYNYIKTTLNVSGLVLSENYEGILNMS